MKNIEGEEFLLVWVAIRTLRFHSFSPYFKAWLFTLIIEGEASKVEMVESSQLILLQKSNRFGQREMRENRMQNPTCNYRTFIPSHQASSIWAFYLDLHPKKESWPLMSPWCLTAPSALSSASSLCNYSSYLLLWMSKSRDEPYPRDLLLWPSWISSIFGYGELETSSPHLTISHKDLSHTIL